MANNNKYIAFLRGINVGGHHRVPMQQLKREMEELGLKNCLTILNTGNVIFDTVPSQEEKLQSLIKEHLESTFGFPIPVLIRKASSIEKMVEDNPFEQIEMNKDIRLYVTFLGEEPKVELDLPWRSDDNSFKILVIEDRTILSVLDLAVAKTPKGMEALEKMFGKNTTTRNWNTLLRLQGKL